MEAIKLPFSNKRPKYIYDRCGHWWYVWEMEYFDNGVDGISSHGEKISPDMDKEEARKETYRLNGWEYKEPINNQFK